MTLNTIAIFSAQYPPHLGGIEVFTQSVAQALAKRGNRVIVVTNDTEGDADGEARTDEDGVEVVRLPCIPLFSGRLPLPRLVKKRADLLLWLHAQEIDGVLINARFYPHSLLGMRVARDHGVVPVVLDHGSAWLSFGNPMLDPVVRLYESAMTFLGRKLYHPTYYGVSEKSVSWLGRFGISALGVISNAIDAEGYAGSSSNRDFRSELGLGESSFVVCFVGRLVPEKGVAHIIEASKSKQLRDRGVVFVLAGDGPLREQVEKSCCSNLKWVGALSRRDVASLMGESDLMCLPTRSEGFSTTLLEAAAMCCPSVVTDVGGARELIPDKSFGTILADASSESLVSAIVSLTGDPALLDEQRRRVHRLVCDGFSWDSTAQKVERACLG